jgi:methylmalonyl-CoA mutase cobalamin-binding subunit
MRTPMAVRRPRKSLVVVAGTTTGEHVAHAVGESLREVGIQTCFLGNEDDPRRIAAAIVDERADAVELCLGGACGVLLLRGLFRELAALGRSEVSIVVHRVDRDIA